MKTELENFLRSPAAVEATAGVAGHLLTPGDQFHGMDVIAFLGAGASAEVWHVRKDGRDLALKILKPDVWDVSCARERFLTEARLLTKFDLAHVVKAYTLDETAPNLYFTMDFLHPLPERVDSRTLLRLLDDVCVALEGLHYQGIVHRDIKPGNVLLNSEDRAVVADLGLVHIADEEMAMALQSAGAHNLTIAGGDRFVGTPGFAAPEQLSGQEVSPASDIYSLGVMASRLLGDRPPRAWKSFIRRATSAIPSLRYGSVQEVRRALKRVKYGQVYSALLAASCLILVAILGYLTWRQLGTDPARVGTDPATQRGNVAENIGFPTVFGVRLGEVCEIPADAKIRGDLRLASVSPEGLSPAYGFFQGYRKFVRPLADNPTRGQTLSVTATSFLPKLRPEDFDRRQGELSREWAEALKQLERELFCTFAKQPRQGNDLVWKSHLDRPGVSGQAEAHFSVSLNSDGTYQVLRLVTVSANPADTTNLTCPNL